MQLGRARSGRVLIPSTQEGNDGANFTEQAFEDDLESGSEDMESDIDECDNVRIDELLTLVTEEDIDLDMGEF